MLLVTTALPAQMLQHFSHAQLVPTLHSPIMPKYLTALSALPVNTASLVLQLPLVHVLKAFTALRVQKIPPLVNVQLVHTNLSKGLSQEVNALCALWDRTVVREVHHLLYVQLEPIRTWYP